MQCKIAKNNDFTCPAVDENDHCTVFTDEGVVAKERHGICNYKEIRKPKTEVAAMQVRVGQQKQKKTKKN